VEEFRYVIGLSRTREEWLKALDQALSPQENAPSRREQRQAVARQHDWEGITGRIAHIIARRLGMDTQSSRLASDGVQATSRLATASEM